MANSDSITEQAARVLHEAMPVSPRADRWDDMADYEKGYWREKAQALADAGLLAHQAPATLQGLRVAMLGTTDGDFIDPEANVPAGEMFRLAAEYLTTHEAPATEDEAAEVEWGIRDRTDFTMPVQDEAYARRAAGDLPDHWTAVCRTPAGPWREVSS